MGRRRNGGAKPQDRILRLQIESARKNYPTVEQLAGHLHLSCRYYTREDRQSFTNRVSKIIQFSSRRKDAMDDFNDHGGTPIIKKRRKIEEEEEKLRIIEAQHVKRRHNDVLNDTGAGRMASAGSLEENGTSDEEESTLVDAIYGEKFGPEFDLMKSMIREKLLQKSKKSGDEREAKEAVELEVVGKKGVKEVHLMNEEGKLGGLSKINKDDNSGKDGNKINKNDNIGKHGNKINKNDNSGKDGNKINKNDNIGKHGNKINGSTFKDLGGMSGVIEELKMKVIVPLCQLRLLRHLGSEPMAGLLLHGPPGCGKTKLAHAIANETGLPFYKTSATELMSAVSGAPEENIRELFSKAYRTAPSIVFIDEIDAIASKREDLQRKMECRIVTQLMTCMDESYKLVEPVDDNAGSESSDCRPGYVLVIGATNRPDAIDPSLRMPGRFDREIVLGVPNECARIEILSVLKSKLKVEDAFDLVKIARLTPGFVGADLAALSREVVNLAMIRILDEVELSKERTDGPHSKDWYKQPLSDEEMEKASITMADFEEACKMVQPSFRREGFSTIPNVKWDDVGGLHLLRKEFDRYIIRRIKFPEYYEDLGLDLETGFLLYGPPGCGKTLIAKALANEAGANFIRIKGPELLSKYVGESELAVRTIFSRARTCSPCIIFFDEVDALTTNRGKEGGWVVERVLNQLLIELDGAEQRRGVYVIGATNRPEVMDRALLRPGRFGKLLYVPLPSPEERGLILNAIARNKSIDANVDLVALGRDSACENLSGADLAALMNEAGMAAIEDLPTSSCRITIKLKDAHFKRALEKISPSVSNEQIEYYKLLSKSLKAA